MQHSRSWRQRGFTLIELMIVLAVVGILSQLAMGQYNQYVARTQIAEAYALLSQPKARILENISVLGEVPRDLPEVDILKSKYVGAVTYTPLINAQVGVAVIAQLRAQFSSEAHPWLVGESFSLMGGAEGSIDIMGDRYNYDPRFLQEGKAFVWHCSIDRTSSKWQGLVRNYCK